MLDSTRPDCAIHFADFKLSKLVFQVGSGDSGEGSSKVAIN